MAHQATTFIQITDTHITASAAERLHGTDSAENFRTVVDAIRQMEIDPAFFAISGDLANNGETDSYRRLHSLIEEELRPFGVPVLLNLGNHDNRQAFREVFLGQTGFPESEPYYYSHIIQGIRVIMLDSKVPGAIHGELGSAQLEWLASQMDNPVDLGNLLILHHPVAPRGIPRTNDLRLADDRELEEVVRGAPVLGILAGHTHVASCSSFAGVLASVAPASAFLLDPSWTDGGRAIEGSGFNLCTVQNGELIVNPIILPSDQRELYRYTSADLERYKQALVSA